MNKRTEFQIPAGNPVANGLVIVAGLAAIVAAIIIGFFAFIVLGSAFLVLAAVVGIRLWWHRFKLRRSGEISPQQTHSGGASMIEGEYKVVETESRESRGPGA
jgi:membrane protein implicated in regulation of membrane protease activity